MVPGYRCLVVQPCLSAKECKLVLALKVEVYQLEQGKLLLLGFP